MPKYQKRHYIDIAKMLNGYVKDGDLALEVEQRMVYDFVALFSRDNELFNPDTFKRAIYTGSGVDLSADVHVPFTRY